MTQSLKVALAQLNPKVGDVAGNLAKVRAARAEAATQGADLVLTAELVLAGYFPEDLVLKPSFVKRCHEAVEELRADTRDGGPALFVGGWALSQLWLFWLAPVVGAALAGVVYTWLAAEDAAGRSAVGSGYSTGSTVRPDDGCRTWSQR